MKITGENKPKPGESRRIAGLNPDGTVNIDGGCAMTKPAGLFCLNRKSKSPLLPAPSPPLALTSVSPEPLSSGKGGGKTGLCCAAGDAMAPARSCEKDLQSSESEKKLETSVMGPGLKPMPSPPPVPGPPPLKKPSAKGRGGREIVGGGPGGALVLDVDDE